MSIILFVLSVWSGFLGMIVRLWICEWMVGCVIGWLVCWFVVMDLCFVVVVCCVENVFGMLLIVLL